MNNQSIAYVIDRIMNEEINFEKDGYYDSDWRYDGVGNYWNIQIEYDSAPTRIVTKTPLVLFNDPSEYGIVERKICPYRNPECDGECYSVDEYEGPEGMEQDITECSCLEEIFENVLTQHTYNYDGADLILAKAETFIESANEPDLPF